MRTLTRAVIFVAITSCSAPAIHHGGDGSTGGGNGGNGSGGNGSGNGGGGGGGGNNGPTFGSMCNGTATTVSGVVMAPNGVDPMSDAMVYVPLSVGQFPAGVSCDLCTTPVDALAVHTQSSTDGHFTLDLSSLPPSGQIQFAIDKGRFRRISTFSVQPCKDNPIAAPHTVLPGKSGAGDDIPKIAVSTGSQDALDLVLNAMGLDATTGYDCFENRSSTSGTATSTCEKRLAAQGASAPQLTDLLKNEAQLSQYNILFISCAFGKYATISAADQATIVANLQTWVGKGGRLFATDRSYDYVAQAFPNYVTFVNGDATVGAANVGVGSVQMPATYSGRVNDPTMAGWLTAIGALSSGQNTVSLTGYLTQWSAVQSVPMATVDEVDATNAQISVNKTTMTGTYPQTVKFDYAPAGSTQACGRGIFSSYHTTSSSSTTLTAQERILEYLMFEAGSCVGPPIG